MTSELPGHWRQKAIATVSPIGREDAPLAHVVLRLNLDPTAGGIWDDDRFRWWRALGTLRWGLGLAGQAAQHLDGRYRSIVMAGSGRRVSELAYDLLLLVRP